jgi:hypothetical protein
MTERLPLLLTKRRSPGRCRESGEYRYIGRNVRRNDMWKRSRDASGIWPTAPAAPPTRV